jgi:hypothetical protein
VAARVVVDDGQLCRGAQRPVPLRGGAAGATLRGCGRRAVRALGGERR